MTWTLAAAGLAAQFLAFPRMVGEKDGPRAAVPLVAAQAGWILLAASLWAAGAAPRIGALNLALQQAVLTLPLAVLLARRRGSPWLVAGLSLALAGCIPFSAFPAYFQTLIPLMGNEGANVTSMHQKLFTGQALLGTLVIFSLLYQTFALGYVSLNRLRNASMAQTRGGWLEVWGWASWVLSLGLGLQSGRVASALSQLSSSLF